MGEHVNGLLPNAVGGLAVVVAAALGLRALASLLGLL